MSVEPSTAIKSEFNHLSPAQQQVVLTNEAFQAHWVSKLAQEFGLDEQVVKQEIERISAIRNGEIEVLVQEAEMEVEAIARAKEAESLARKEAEANLIQEKLAEIAIIKTRLEAGMSIEEAESTPFTPKEMIEAKPQIAQDYTLAQASVELDEPKFGTRQRRTYTKFMTESWSETPILQPVAETDGDCSCIYAPTYTEGGYIVEQWTYKGQPTNEYDTNPPYAKIIHKWEWEEKAGKSDIPQPDKSDNKVRIAKSGYRATGLTTQEYIVKPSLMPTSWKKYRITTATGFQKFGCMDSTAQNYVEGAVAEDPDNPCEYCHDSDTHSEYDSDAGKCVCKAGYKRGILGTFGKCVKDKQTKTTPSPDPTPEKTFTATGLVAGIVGLTAVGIVVSTVISAKNQEN